MPDVDVAELARAGFVDTFLRGRGAFGIADALGDKMYILFGTIISHGLQYKIEEIFDEIHRSNMSKLDDNGQPIYREDGKIMKSENYFKPNIKIVLDK